MAWRMIFGVREIFVELECNIGDAIEFIESKLLKIKHTEMTGVLVTKENTGL